MNKSIIKEYAWAALVTFLAAFALSLSATDAPANQSALFGVIAAAGREAFRAAFNLVVTRFTTVSSRPQQTP